MDIVKQVAEVIWGCSIVAALLVLMLCVFSPAFRLQIFGPRTSREFDEA